MEKINFDVANPELAEIVLEVANECYCKKHDGSVIKLPDIEISISISIAGFEDIFEKIKFEKDQERIEREKLEEEIKIAIQDDYVEGYRKAFKLCGDIDNEQTREIRYKCIRHIEDIPLEQKIDVCLQYSEISETEEVTYSLANYKFKQNKNKNLDDLSEALGYFIKAYELSKDKMDFSLQMIRFSKDNNLLEWMFFWIDTFTASPGNKPERFWEDIFKMLLTDKQYNKADEFLIKWEEKVLSNMDNTYMSQIGTIETYKESMKYYRKGYKCYFSPTKIEYYDCIDDTIKEIALIKSKYKNSFQRHRKYLVFSSFYSCGNDIVKKNLYKDYRSVIEEELEVIYDIVCYLNEMTPIFHLYEKNKYFMINSYMENLCYFFKRLSIDCAKNGRIDDAIWLCEKALQYGLTNDGTKSGMEGRLRRLKNRKDKET